LNQHPFKDNVNAMPSVLAAVMTAPLKPIELREFPRPDLPPGAALLRTSCSEVCGTDVHLWHGRLAGVPYPIIPGHVSAGTIDAMRGSITGVDGTILREGDRAVFFDVHRTCGRCRACTVHRTPTRCSSRRVYGISDSANEGLFGGWTLAIYLEPGVVMARLPDAVDLDDYIGGGCGLLTAVHIVERAEIRLGDTVVVQGTGAVGLCAIALARLAGASKVVAIGAPESRLALAREMGADVTLDLQKTSPEQRKEAVLDATLREGADAVLEAAGAASAIAEGLDLLRVGGRYVIAGHYTDVGDCTINAHTLINRKHVEIRGCWGSEPRHFLRALTVLDRQRGRIPFRKIGAKRYGLSELNAALADAEAMRIPKALVDPWK
jgi:threonine dehydrogenase-like Zn-dependent dehydrogenase